MQPMLVSIVIPARNESEDIANTLEACLKIGYEPKEIIVVDDSTDDTPQIVQRYADQGVRLIHRDRNDDGCCGARNLGMQNARGEIVVLFNADNLPRPDFLKRLLPHYEAGADYVVVRSAVINQNVLWGKYVAAAGKALGDSNPEWSEGFSCRRSAVESIGYIPGKFPVPFCRDFMLGAKLKEAGFNKRVDLDIPVEHVVPNSLAGFWHNRVWRGTFAAPYAYYFRDMRPAMITLREILKAGRVIVKYLLILPALYSAFQVARFAPRGWRETPDMLGAAFIADLATIIGGGKGLLRLWSAL